MRTLIYFFMSIFLAIHHVKAIDMKKIPTVTLTAPDEQAIFIERFKGLAKSINDKDNRYIDYANNLMDSYEAFEDVIFLNTSSKSVSRDISNFVNNLTTIYDLATEGNVSYYIRLFFQEQLMPLLEKRIELAKLDENTKFGGGTKAPFYIGDWSKHHPMSTITGRLFRITDDRSPVGRGQSPLLSSCTATLINWNNNNINSIAQGSQLNAILTCAHCISPKEGHSEIYFVQSQNLNPKTGWPDVPGLKITGYNTLLGFLRDNAMSFRIDKFSIYNKNANQIIENQDTYMSKPQYTYKEDIVVGHIALNNHAQQQYPVYQEQNSVNFIKNWSRLAIKYFALGYPRCPHYKIDDYSLSSDYDLVKLERVYPLFITSSSQKPFVRDEKIYRTPPTSKGMSGGPLYYFEGNNINIFGVIMSGDVKNDFGCPVF